MRCPLCTRTPAQHWRRRLCGPLTGTAAGPMSDDERARYVAAWAASVPSMAEISTIPDPLNPDPAEANCTCGAPDVAHCDGCLACPGDAHDEACGW